MNKRGFERFYCGNSGITLKQYREYKVTLPCACDYEGCQGWAAIIKDPYIISDHRKFYAPKEEE